MACLTDRRESRTHEGMADKRSCLATKSAVTSPRRVKVRTLSSILLGKHHHCVACLMTSSSSFPFVNLRRRIVPVLAGRGCQCNNTVAFQCPELYYDSSYVCLDPESPHYLCAHLADERGGIADICQTCEFMEEQDRTRIGDGRCHLDLNIEGCLWDGGESRTSKSRPHAPVESIRFVRKAPSFPRPHNSEHAQRPVTIRCNADTADTNWVCR